MIVYLLIILLLSCTPSENKIFQLSKQVTSDPCTDPYYTTVIDGITYSGSTQTANQAYLGSERKLKKILYDESLDEITRWRRVKNIQENMTLYSKFRCLCKANCQSNHQEFSKK